MKISDKLYDIIKWILVTFVPALILLITTLGTIYNFDVNIVVATISALATFVGGLLGISTANYYKNKSQSKEG